MEKSTDKESKQNHLHSHSHNSICKLTKTQSLIFMLCLTSTFFIVELVVGHLTKSNALVADAFHMLSDLISLIIGLIAVRMSKKTSPRNTFGWVRAEVLGSLINAVFLLALCFSIIIEAINRFISPEELVQIDLMLIVGGIGLGINLIGLLIFGMHGHEHGHSHSHSHSKNNNCNTKEIITELNIEIKVIEQIEYSNVKKEKKQRVRNMNIHGVFLHVLSDALGSIAVIISGLIVKYGPPKDDTSAKWKLYIDPILSLIITILIIISTIPLLKEASLVLLQTVPKNFDIEDLKKLINKVEGVIDIHHFHVWSLNSEKLVASAHLILQKQNNGKELFILQEVKKLLHKNDIHSTTLQLEYIDTKTNDNSNDYDYCEGSDCNKKQCCVSDREQLIKRRF